MSIDSCLACQKTLLLISATLCPIFPDRPSDRNNLHKIGNRAKRATRPTVPTSWPAKPVKRALNRPLQRTLPRSGLPYVLTALTQPEDSQVPVNKKTVAKVGDARLTQSRSIFGVLSGLFAWFSILYVLIAVFWRCPSQPFSFQFRGDHDLLVCREIASIQEHVTPALAEFKTSARKHLDPYVGSYLDKAEEAWTYVKPALGQGATHAHTVFTTHVQPGARELAKQAHTWSLPHQRTLHKHYKKHMHPHVDGTSLSSHSVPQGGEAVPRHLPP